MQPSEGGAASLNTQANIDHAKLLFLPRVKILELMHLRFKYMNAWQACITSVARAFTRFVWLASWRRREWRYQEVTFR